MTDNTVPPGNANVSLLFFRSRPDAIEQEYVASALQGCETAFFLIALRRYPSALSAISSALEGALQASPIGGRERDGLDALFQKAQRHSPKLRGWNDATLEQFRLLRNKFVHRGFSFRDDEPSIRAILTVGFRLLETVFDEFLKFSLRAALLPDYAGHWRIAEVVLERGDAQGFRSEHFCLSAFEASIRWSLKDSFQASWEWTALGKAEENNSKFELLKLREEIVSRFLERDCGGVCRLDCPICLEYDGAIVGIDDTKLALKVVSPARFECVHCGFSTLREQRTLTEELLRNQLEKKADSILAEYGLGGAGN